MNTSGGSIENVPWQVNVYAFDVSKSNNSVLYCGTETGFLNKTVDNGENWQLLAKDYSFGGGITAISIDPLNDDIVYVSAKKQIHKTTDGGLSWTPLLPSDNLFYSDKIIIDQSNTNKVICAGTNGIQISNDGGINWATAWNFLTYDIHFNTNDPNKLYAITSVNDEFKLITSSDGGINFSEDATFPSNLSDESGALLAVTPNNQNFVYILMLSSNNTPLLYKGIANTSWELINTGQSDIFPLENWQGFYDLVFEVSPNDANIIFAGTSSLYKSVDGGANFDLIGGYGGNFKIHPDAQCMLLLDNQRAWLSTDGGLTYSTDNFSNVSNAYSKNKNIVGSEMWGFDQGWNEDIIVGGRYHNGNAVIADFYQSKSLSIGGAESPTGWLLKGKSRHAAFNDLGPGYILPSSVDSMPEGRFPFSKYPNMDEYGYQRGNMVFHPNYFETIYLGEGNSIWKSSDMGVTFELLNDFNDNVVGVNNRVRYLQISHSHPNIMYADIKNKGLYKSEDGGYTWQQKPTLTNGLNGGTSWQGRLQFDISPNNPNTLYACLQNGLWSNNIGKVFKSTDGGDSWEEWTANLTPYTKWIVVQSDSIGNDIVYLFTLNKNDNDGNCYIRRSNENEWTVYGQDYPVGTNPICVLPFYRDSKLRMAGTSGVWEISLDDQNFLPTIQPWTNSPLINCITDTIQLDDHSIINHQNCSWSWNIEPEPSYIQDANIRNPKVVLGAVGSYNITLSITKNGQTYSKTINQMITATECPSLENCNNPDFVNKENWELKYVDSEEINYPGYASMSFDNNSETIWHTKWSTGSDSYPHQLEVDMGDEFKIYEFTYQTRQDGENGRIKDFELYFSNDLNDFGEADTISQFINTSSPQTLIFNEPKVGRYFKLVALSEVNGNDWASAAEFYVKACFNTSHIDPIKLNSLKGFPVPTQGLFEVSLPSKEPFEYQLLNIDGQLVDKGMSTFGQQSIQLNLSNLSDGLYIIKLKDIQNRFYYVKAIKE